MSLPSATGQRALDVPATPTTPLVDASLGRAPQVLTQAPLGTEKKPKDRLALYGAGSSDLVTQYFTQVYRWKASDVVSVSSWDDVQVELQRCSSIGELVILSHAVYDAVEINGAQLTSNQFAERFEKVAPPIGSLSFDGCVIGHDPAGLHGIATRLKIPTVRAWSYWHYFDWWRPTPNENVEASLELVRPFMTSVSPYLPKSLDGKDTYSVAEQEPLFATSSLKVVGEYFVESLMSEVGPTFMAAILANAIDPAVHRTRVSAEPRLIDSGAAQGALETALLGRPSLFARVVVTPWI